MAPVNDAASLFNVNGMVAVITGGGSGLGVYAARALDANGAKAVYIVGRREETLQKAAATGKNGTIRPLVGDVTDPESLKKVVATIEREEGFVNLLFANAGVLKQAHGGVLQDALGDKKEPPTIEEFSKAYLDSNPADFTDTMHVNCTGVFYSTVAFLPLLKKGTEKRNIPQDSQVIVTSSIAGFSRGLAASFAYSASKAAVTHLVKVLSTFFAQNGWRIRVNLIVPGFYPSEMTGGMLKDMDFIDGVAGHEHAFEGAVTMAKEKAPAERSGSEEDFAGTILYLASRGGAYINGNALVTDGGRLAQMPSVY